MNDLEGAIAESLGVKSVEIEGLQSGALSSTGRVIVPGDDVAFLKRVTGAPPDQLPAEGRGLDLMRATGAVKVPRVLAVSPDFLILEQLRAAPSTPKAGARLGRELAAMHRTTSEAWGLDFTTYCGRTPQPAGWSPSLISHFRDDRIGLMRSTLGRQGTLPKELEHGLERIQERMDHWLGDLDEAPALVHGDLWGGNWVNTPGDVPYLIDPSPTYGFREVDLAMSELFGGFPLEFQRAYRQEFPLADGYEMRRPLLNLYPLLNHAVLFGGGYFAQSQRAVSLLASEVG